MFSPVSFGDLFPAQALKSDTCSLSSPLLHKLPVAAFQGSQFAPTPSVHPYWSHPILSASPVPAVVFALLLYPSKNSLFLHCTNVVSLVQPRSSAGSPLHWLSTAEPYSPRWMASTWVWLVLPLGLGWPSDDLLWNAGYCRLREWMHRLLSLICLHQWETTIPGK